jgi:hypothetical protein
MAGFGAGTAAAGMGCFGAATGAAGIGTFGAATGAGTATAGIGGFGAAIEAAGIGGFGTATAAAGIGGLGAATGAATATGFGGSGAAGAPPGIGIPAGFVGMLKGFGGAGMVGGAPVAVGKGLGGRFTIAASRGLAAVGPPSRLGGRTIRTVSFFGSAGLLGSLMGLGSEIFDPEGGRELFVSEGLSIVSPAVGENSAKSAIFLAHGAAPGHSPRPFFELYGQDLMERAREAQTQDSG